jgi:predicted transcriptional regulator
VVRRNEAKKDPERRGSGDLEGEVLSVLWAAAKPLVPAEVQAALTDELAYTTVMTILVRLHDKGLVDREKSGRAYAYRPTVAENEVVADQVRRLLGRARTRSAVLQGRVEGLDPADEAVLRSLLAEATRRREEERP